MYKKFVCIIVVLLLVSTVFSVVGKQPISMENKSDSPITPTVKGDGTDWPMIRHDPSHTGASPSHAPTTSTVLWNRTVGFPAASSPLEYSNRVYVSSSDGVLYCLDAQTGGTVWMSPSLGGSLEDDAGIANDKVYISADKFYCFDALDGTPLWNQTTGANGRSPTIANDKVYVGADEVYCFDAENGSMIWSFTMGNTSFFTSPAIVDDTVFVGDVANAQLYCLNASTGTLNWNISLSQYGQSSTSPAVAEGRVYISTLAGEVLCFDAMNGNLTWEQLTGDQIRSSPAISTGHIYFGCNNTYVYCYDALTGAVVWGTPTGSPVNSSPAVADGKVYISSDKFYCFDATTGSQLWNFSTSGGVSSPAIANGTAFVCSNDQQVYCFTDSYPPEVPTTPVGPANAGPAIPLNFSTVATDFEGNQIYYWWDWGDGNNTDWVGPFDSGESMTMNYSWINNGTYDIRVKAKDSTGLESAWSDPLTISIAPQISLAPYKVGYIYLKFFHFNNSYFYSELLFGVGITVVVSNLDLFVAAQTSTAVHSVLFTAFSPILNESVYREDDNGTNGFSCTFNITRNVYAITLTAFDANGTLIDRSIFSLLFFLRFGSPPDGLLQRAIRGHHAVHH